MSILAPDEISIEDPLCNSSLGSMVTLDYVTPLTGYEPQEMELTDADELNLATSSDIYFQNALDDTASFPNVPDVDDNELAEFLAVVVDRTGQPVEVRSNNDQFSCDIRNLKSAQSQFPLVTQPKRMISQTGGSVQERIAEERESSNAQIRTMLDEQRRTIIAEYSEKVLHHELLAAQAEQDRKILQEELLRQQQDFREVHQQDLMKQKELQKFQNSTFDEFLPEEVHRGSEDYARKRGPGKDFIDVVVGETELAEFFSKNDEKESQEISEDFKNVRWRNQAISKIRKGS